VSPIGRATVKAKVIALYALVLSNANHRRQNVRRAAANRARGRTAAPSLLRPRGGRPCAIPYVTSSTYLVHLSSKARSRVLSLYALWNNRGHIFRSKSNAKRHHQICEQFKDARINPLTGTFFSTGSIFVIVCIAMFFWLLLLRISSQIYKI